MKELLKKYEQNAKTKILDFPQWKCGYIMYSLLCRTNPLSTKEHCELVNKTAEDLWKELGDIPINRNDEIAEDWYSFSKGTNRFEIWTWFEEAFDLSVAINLMHLGE